MTATPFFPGSSSSSWNVLPATGATPSTRKRLADTTPPASCSGTPRPVRLKVESEYAAIDSKEWLRFR
jgi:hypothetical protein